MGQNYLKVVLTRFSLLKVVLTRFSLPFFSSGFLFCGPSCGAMLVRGTGNPASQSAIALRQGAVMSDDAARLAGAMNDLARTPGVWKGGFINVFTNPIRTFAALSRNGSFATTLRAPSMKISHMVVVDGLDDAGRVIVRDPYGGTRYLMNWDDFTNVWEGKSIYR